MKIDLSVKLCRQKLTNPLILAAGILSNNAELLARVANQGLGAVTSKSCSLKPRQGHENPTVIAWDHGIQNAVGLSNPGVSKQVQELKKLRLLLKNKPTKIIASFFGATIKEYVQVAKALNQAKPDFLEANISCPNTESDLGRPFGTSKRDTYKLTKAIKKVAKYPIIVKLTANVTDISEIAKAAEKGGADLISAINTVSSMIIDIESGTPILTNKIGGISGPAVKPIAVRCIYEIANTVKIPIIGIGGVSYGKDAIEIMMAGASAVGIGSATYYRGISAFSKITKEIKEFMQKHKYKNLNQIQGVAL